MCMTALTSSLVEYSDDLITQLAPVQWYIITTNAAAIVVIVVM